MKFENRSVPVSQLREETMGMACKLEAKSPSAVRFTKECIRTVRRMTKDQAAQKQVRIYCAWQANDEFLRPRCPFVATSP